MIVSILIASVLNLTTSFTTPDSLEIVEVTTSKELQALDTNYVFEEIQVNETKGLIKDIAKLSRLHFKKIVFVSPKRKVFPFYKRKVVELEKCEFIAPELIQLPNFISKESLKELLIESGKYKVDSTISEFKSLTFLALFCQSKTFDTKIICGMKKLEEIAIETKLPKILDSLDCLFGISNLKSLSLNLSVTSIHLLNNFKNLKKVYFQNVLSYKQLTDNVSTLKKYERVSVELEGLTDEEKRLIKHQIKIW